MNKKRDNENSMIGKVIADEMQT